VRIRVACEGGIPADRSSRTSGATQFDFPARRVAESPEDAERKNSFVRRFSCLEPLRHSLKNSSSIFLEISAYHNLILRPQEGRFAIVTSVGRGMRWTRSDRMTCGTSADCEIVWSWRPWAGAKQAGDDPAGDGLKGHGHRGEHDHKR
jgi:hypothetical protein